jgi:formamidopyrimidine-DNA glycosylase
LGNIYVCEALHRAGINPNRAGGRISLERLRRLVPAIRQVLTEAIEAGGSTLRDYVQPDGALGYFSKSFAVYDREGASCTCGGTVKRFAQGGRSTWHCPACQR